MHDMVFTEKRNDVRRKLQTSRMIIIYAIIVFEKYGKFDGLTRNIVYLLTITIF